MLIIFIYSHETHLFIISQIWIAIILSKSAQMDRKLILLFGATGKSGFHIATSLLDSGFPLRIVVRSRSKAAAMFKEKQTKFQGIIEGQMNEETLNAAFRTSPQAGKVSYVISALGATLQTRNIVEEVQYCVQIKIIQKCLQMKIEKYIFLTAMRMQRPWSPFTVFLNTLVPRVYHWKAKAENYLRKSGLDYIIVRPPALRGNENDQVLTDYLIDQGDKVTGHMSRRTLGKLVNDLMKLQLMPSKVTFECISTKKKQENCLSFSELNRDTQKSLVTADHITPKKIYGLLLLACLVLYFFTRISD